MVAILREYGTERMLVNSAADWGRSDPLKTRKTAEAMLAAGFTERRRRQGAVAATRSRSSARAAGCELDRGRRRLVGHLRGQLDPARDVRGRRRALPARRRHRPSTSPTAPTSTPPRTSTACIAQLDALRASRCASGSASTGSGSGCGSRADVAAPPRRRPGGAAPAARAARPRTASRCVTLNGFPYARLPRRGRQAARLPARLDRPERARATRSTCAAVLAELLPDDADRGQHLDPAARLARRRGRADGDAAAATTLDRARRRPRRAPDRTGRPIRVGLEPEPGCVRRDHRADAVARARRGLDPDVRRRLPRHLPPRGRVRGPGRRAAPARRRRASRVVKVQAVRALPSSDPPIPSRATALAAFAEPRFLHQVRERAARRRRARHRRPARALDGALPADGVRGASTSTSRCTPSPSRR